MGSAISRICGSVSEPSPPPPYSAASDPQLPFGSPEKQHAAEAVIPVAEKTVQHSDEEILDAFYKAIQSRILPQTTERVVNNGACLAGAGIFRKSDLSLVMTGTNDFRTSPLFHGETHCIHEFFTRIPDEERPHPRDCVFLTTHEPCPMCLSCITWSGFDNFYYFFSHEQSRDLQGDPHDIRILESVFKLQGKGESASDFKARPRYRHENRFWNSNSIEAMVYGLGDGPQKKRLVATHEEITEKYQELLGKMQKIDWPPVAPCKGRG